MYHYPAYTRQDPEVENRGEEREEAGVPGPVEDEGPHAPLVTPPPALRPRSLEVMETPVSHFPPQRWCMSPRPQRRHRSPLKEIHPTSYRNRSSVDTSTGGKYTNVTAQDTPLSPRGLCGGIKDLSFVPRQTSFLLEEEENRSLPCHL
ncbi:ORF11 [Psittacine aviadenovirus B]|uniref:ORF11 n=1 Tax=psittacine adenovirus 4 TaxID=2773287 RepID=A0A1P8SW82_9ADEN|nr:ORF11 [Psittacine aviadenovirus B]APY28357.1 ORF11 [psittacine adenovirus 4]